MKRILNYGLMIMLFYLMLISNVKAEVKPNEDPKFPTSDQLDKIEDWAEKNTSEPIKKTCKYSNGELSVSFIVNYNGKDKRASILGFIDSTDQTYADEGETVKNWDNAYEAYFLRSPTVSFVGKEYYLKNLDCPPYAILYDRLSGFNLVVSDEEHLEEFISFGQEKQGYSVMCLEGTDCNNYIAGSCASYNYEKACKGSSLFSCVWVDADNSNGGYCNVDNLQYVVCGDAFDIPQRLPSLTSFFINLLKIMVPIILIITSIITLVKAIMASKEDEIKKATSTLVRRIIAAVIVFFVIYIVQFVIMKVADSSEKGAISSCLSCFVNNDCNENKYYKTNVSGEYVCTYLDGTPFGGNGVCPEDR